MHRNLTPSPAHRQYHISVSMPCNPFQQRNSKSWDNAAEIYWLMTDFGIHSPHPSLYFGLKFSYSSSFSGFRETCREAQLRHRQINNLANKIFYVYVSLPNESTTKDYKYLKFIFPWFFVFFLFPSEKYFLLPTDCIRHHQPYEVSCRARTTASESYLYLADGKSPLPPDISTHLLDLYSHVSFTVMFYLCFTLILCSL